MADLFGAIVIAAGTVIAACINAAQFRAQGKNAGARKANRSGKARSATPKRKSASPASNRTRRRTS